MAFSKDINELVTEDTTGLLNKHESWERVTLQDVVEVVNGYAFSSSGFNTGKGLPLIRIRDIVSGKTDTTYEGDYSKDYIVENGDLLVGMDGDFHSAFWRSGIALLNQRVCKLTANENFYNQKFLAYLLPGYLDAINQNTSAVTVKHLSSKTIQSIPLPLPTRKEQDRLVEKLEELFSEFDNGIEELKAAQTKLSRYRQSLLKSAVEGSLTQQWRAENSDRVQETGEQLLARILKQRREQWLQQKLAEFAEKGKTPSKNWQDAYPEPVQPDTTDLPELPKGWVWATIDQLASVGTGVTPLKSRNDYYDNGDIPWVTSGAVNEESVYRANTFITRTAVDECRLKIYPAGTLLVAMYGEGKTRGMSAELKIPATINQALAALILEGEASVLKEFLKIYLLDSYQKMRSKASGGVQPNLNLLIVRSMCVPIPCVREQQEIHQLYKFQAEEIETQVKSIKFSLVASDAQRKNILKSAFSGQLVSQDPNDEPASVLLEKIKKEREALAKKPKTKQIKTKSAMKKITVEELTKWVSDYEGSSFTFEELQKIFQGDYDQLKDCVFEMLSANKPLFKQVFDQKLNAITFIKEDK
ncbi:restriction endonuclease subunit S [Shewanella sp. CG12_big_fil_rev_8_21_14_0_65_47_15]|uniref:restriction endonuclease subunit S n=1 Tax=Shewanella sp. CG12_big_fil_rev_8_21_14_0_65_47_15 TaxID=1975537 RepID=UPI000CCA9105|nr:restriction endonuclease subunit S [Shewanella sp. CG12_big_fil_rev_8_21_14_0_65_47_15]PIW59472.1 MAG: restriction endonuclease subunit S [Shewanella sp. CG12_big_fil_rev_8_21_14_0_65_47_15]